MLIGCNLRSVTADVHTAPSAGAFFACIPEVDDTGFALTDARRLDVREQLSRRCHKWSPDVFRPLWLKYSSAFQLRSFFVQGDALERGGSSHRVCWCHACPGFPEHKSGSRSAFIIPRRCPIPLCSCSVRPSAKARSLRPWTLQPAPPAACAPASPSRSVPAAASGCCAQSVHAPVPRARYGN